MKVVYNNDYGGFSLSKEAIEWLLDHNIEEPFKSQLLIDLPYSICYAFDEYEFRTHPLLVQCVEELGEKASGRFADVSVIDINADEFFIWENDGAESVMTLDMLKTYTQYIP